MAQGDFVPINWLAVGNINNNLGSAFLRTSSRLWIFFFTPVSVNNASDQDFLKA